VIEAAAITGQENTLRLFNKWAKRRIVAKECVDIARLCTAAKEGHAEVVLELTRQGVPLDKQDVRGTTPL
jgi:hypothetical protein